MLGWEHGSGTTRTFRKLRQADQPKDRPGQTDSDQVRLAEDVMSD